MQAGGGFAGYIGSCIDITNRKQAEAALHKQAIIFESISDGVIITDLEGLIIDWNPAATKMFGYGKAEVIGQTAGILHRPEESAVLTQQIIQGMVRDNCWSGEITFIRKDGAEGICETVVVPLYDRRRQLVGTIGLNHDITIRKQTEIQLREMSAALTNAVECISRLDGQGRYIFVNEA